MAPDVSTATGWKMKRRPNSAYLAIFLTSAASATDPAASAARIRFEDANVLSQVASQMKKNNINFINSHKKLHRSAQELHTIYKKHRTSTQ